MQSREKIVIREIEVADAEILKCFWLNLAREMFEIEGHIVPSVKNAEVWTSYILKSVEQGRVDVLIARKNGEPVGFINWSYPTRWFQTSTRQASVDNLYVKPAYRRRGVGTRLMEEAMNRIREKGVGNVEVSVLSDNVKAVRFYEKFGLRVYRYGMRKEL